jgi:hypothetical protein
MIDLLKKLQKLVEALVKLVPVLIDVLADLADDGKRNHSSTSGRNSGTTN